MSDGNFNRALLPHTPFQSGLKTGKSMARMQAQEAFADFLDYAFPTLTEAEKKQHAEHFRMLLSQRIH